MELHKGQQAVVDRAARFNVVWVGRQWGKGVLAGHLAEKPGSILLIPQGFEYTRECCPATEGALCGRSASRIIVDEAPRVRDLARLFRTAILPSIVDIRGDVWFLGTALDTDLYSEKASDFLKLFRRGLDGEPGWMSYRASSKENPAFPTEMLAEWVGSPEMVKQEFLVGS